MHPQPQRLEGYLLLQKAINNLYKLEVFPDFQQKVMKSKNIEKYKPRNFSLLKINYQIYDNYNYLKIPIFIFEQLK